MTEDEAIADLLQTLRETPRGEWVPPLSAWADMCGVPAHRAHNSVRWREARTQWRVRWREGEEELDRRIWLAVLAGKTRKQISEELNVGFTRIERVKSQNNVPRRVRYDWVKLEGDLRGILADQGRVHVTALMARWSMPRGAIDSWALRRWRIVPGQGYRGGWFYLYDEKK